ncbi:MAG: quinone oxidoreductase [Gammaproteobacteria bacterium]|nr:quinone oxidoreductase [Gammaproteobacteria bacterium]MCY4220013.1 quinone oxidoreductase [Gammaproteobacteria bacterium]MCY4275578.1 quinone oxidoreductase [Gammaproteobacteria bacterium]
MTNAIRIYEPGGAENLRWENVDVGEPDAGQVRIRQSAVGLNFIDIYMRTGLYPLPSYPAVLGMEAAGIVESIGPNVDGISVGDRVAYCMVPGAYSESRLISAEKLLKLPDLIDDRTAAAMMLKGLTAHYLLFRSYSVKPGDRILVMAAAGGVGLMLCQWGRYLGAEVIGCVGSDSKAELAKANGAHHVILYNQENIPQRVKEITGGQGVAVAYDSVGQATFEASLDSLRPFGVLVTYGNASGPVEPFSPAILAPKGSLYVTRPTLATHTATRELLKEGADRLFQVVVDGTVDIAIHQTYALSDTATAHFELESRITTGASVLIP